jgi:hypothetical protein
MGFYVVAIAVSLLLIASPVYACLGPDLEYSIFYKKVPVSKTTTDVFVEVVLEDVRDGTALAQVTKVFQAPTGSLQQGDKVLLKYNFTSCGPNLQVGEKGTIFAKVSVSEKGQKILNLYLRKYGDIRYGDGWIPPFERIRDTNTHY